MNNRQFAGKFFAIAAGIMLGVTMLSPLSASADNLNTVDPIQISPICSTAADMTASWSAYNKNAFPVTFNWTNKDTGVSGAYTAPASTTTDFTTNYKTGENNQTEFTNEGSTSPVDRNASSTECTPVVPPVIPCVDGNMASNLVTTWDHAGTFTVHTVGNAPLCDDVTIFASSYILPANYDGGSFGNPTTYPQNIYDSGYTVLEGGTDGDTTLTVDLPDNCNNSQEDLYYAPEITIVGADGHGDQFLNGGITPKTTDTCQTGGMGGGPTGGNTGGNTGTPTPTPTPSQPTGGKGAGPIVAPTPVATTLSDTGTDTRPASFIAVALLATAAFVATRRSKVTQQ